MTNEIAPTKLAYKDGDDLGEDFCRQRKCGGTEVVGECGGESCYGCDGRDEFIEKYFDSHCEIDHALEVIATLEGKLKIAIGALIEIRESQDVEQSVFDIAFAALAEIDGAYDLGEFK